MFAKSFTAALLGTTLMATAAFAQTPTTTTADRDTAAPAAASSSIQGQWRASKLVGLNVYNQANESLGDINELILDSSGKVTQVILGVGGFLGVGERYVAVPYEKLQWVNEPVRSSATASSQTGTSTTPPIAPSASSTTASGSTATPSGATGTSSGLTTGAASTSSSSSANRWYPDHAVYNASKDELKSMPEFKYNQ